MQCSRAVGVLTICAVLLPASLCADVVTDWNSLTLEVIKESDTRPPAASRILAMVHIAIYDSVNGVYQTHEPYYVAADPPRNTSPVAAAAAAAYWVLVEYFPEYTSVFDQELDRSLRYVRDYRARTNGAALGAYVAGEILTLRADDGYNEVVEYTPSDLPGKWRPTPPDFADALAPNWPYIEPFALRYSSQFRPGPPPDLRSRHYTEAFYDVLVLGEERSRKRTRDQTEIAFFWADDSDSVTPPGRWNVIAQIIAQKKRNSLPANARLFALLNIALADCSIAAWDCKYKYDLWRPITAIREARTDYNPDTKQVDNWTPLLPTPPFSEYISGHSTFGAASAEILASFFGSDNIRFTLESDHPRARRRSFGSFSQAAMENGRSRIYGGIHYQFGNVGGLQTGERIGKYVYRYYLRPFKGRM